MGDQSGLRGQKNCLAVIKRISDILGHLRWLGAYYAVAAAAKGGSWVHPVERDVQSVDAWAAAVVVVVVVVAGVAGVVVGPAPPLDSGEA